ncbi:unnamed protein product, partial [Brassica rapa subsp. trilocularis]
LFFQYNVKHRPFFFDVSKAYLSGIFIILLIYQFNVILQDYIIEWLSYLGIYLGKKKANFILVHHETTLYG